MLVVSLCAESVACVIAGNLSLPQDVPLFRRLRDGAAIGID